MKKFKRLTSLICVVLMIGLLFAACGNTTPPNTSTSPAPGSTAGSSEAPPAKKVTLRFSWWGADVRHEATLAAIKAYQDANPHVTVEAEYSGFEGYQQKLMTQLAGGTAPDLIQFDNVWIMDLSSQQTQLLADLNTYKGVIDLSQFDAQILESYCSFSNKLLGVPMGTNGSGIMANKDFLQKYNISLDTEYTWDSLLELGKKVHEQNPNDYLLGIDPSSESVVPLYWEPFILGATGQYWVGDDFTIKASKQDMVNALTLFKNLYASGTAVPMGETISFPAKMEQHPKVVNGEIGMLIDWSGRLPAVKGSIGEEKFAVMQMPIIKDGKASSYATKPSLLLGVTEASKNKDEAAKFAGWIVGSEEAALIVKDVRSIPTSKFARDLITEAGVANPDVVKMVNNTLKNPSPAPPYVGRNSEIVAIVSEVMQKVVYDKETVEEGADEIISRVQTKLDSLKAQ